MLLIYCQKIWREILYFIRSHQHDIIKNFCFPFAAQHSLMVLHSTFLWRPQIWNHLTKFTSMSSLILESHLERHFLFLNIRALFIHLVSRLFVVVLLIKIRFGIIGCFFLLLILFLEYQQTIELKLVA